MCHFGALSQVASRLGEAGAEISKARKPRVHPAATEPGRLLVALEDEAFKEILGPPRPAAQPRADIWRGWPGCWCPSSARRHHPPQEALQELAELDISPRTTGMQIQKLWFQALLQGLASSHPVTLVFHFSEDSVCPSGSGHLGTFNIFKEAGRLCFSP